MKLTCLKGTNAGESREFNPPGIFVGRQEENDLHILEEGVSQYHSKILFADGKWIIYDLNSSNGTKVNGKYISKATELESKDLIHFAQEAYRFEYEVAKEETKKLSEDTDECIRIRSPEESKSSSKLEMTDTAKFSKIDEEKENENAPHKTKEDLTDAKKMRQLVNKAIMEKKKKLRTMFLIIAIIINAIVLVIGLLWLHNKGII